MPRRAAITGVLLLGLTALPAAQGTSPTIATHLFAVGTSMVPIGLLDHWLLVRLVREAREATAPSDPVASTRQG